MYGVAGGNRPIFVETVFSLLCNYIGFTAKVNEWMFASLLP
jgi:hypothetical protein